MGNVKEASPDRIDYEDSHLMKVSQLGQSGKQTNRQTDKETNSRPRPGALKVNNLREEPRAST